MIFTAREIELFDDEIDTMRSFDPLTQMSLESIDKFEIYPARELIFLTKKPRKKRSEKNQGAKERKSFCPTRKSLKTRDISRRLTNIFRIFLR
ncbi:MAG: hypothetical protein L6V93_11770 [Clostridiales bacterium]|nr:MAG: hypothetical protein L6V93_11770 [Clostridiales bacterium]